MNGYKGTIYGFSYVWKVNALTGKVDMTPDDVLETVNMLIESRYKDGVEDAMSKVWELGNKIQAMDAVIVDGRAMRAVKKELIGKP